MTDLSLGWHVIQREHEVLIVVGGDVGPSFAGGSRTGLLEFESYILLQHLRICKTPVPHWIWKGFSNTAVILVLIFYG